LTHILIATDAWQPQVNGVVRTLNEVARAASRLGVTISFLTPDGFSSVPMPFYEGLRLAIPAARAIAQRIATVRPDVIHIATEGPIGHAVRRYCLARGLPFTTSFHTRFPDYVTARLPLPEDWIWRWLRRFHRAGAGVMAATPALCGELGARGFRNVMLWPRGVDADLFRPRPRGDLGVPRPVFMSVGRVAVEKNLDAFLALDLPGSKVVVGDGPARVALQARFPQALFLGAKQGEELAALYASADVFVFPSRTDTYGLVLLEALASGVPVAAFAVTGPRDVIGDAPVGALDEDLQAACLRALAVPRAACRAFAVGHSWEASARLFVANVTRVARRGETVGDAAATIAA